MFQAYRPSRGKKTRAARVKRVVCLIVWPATSYSTYEPRTRHASRPRANKSESGWSAINASKGARSHRRDVVICYTPSKISRLSRVSRTRIVFEVFSKAPFIVLPFAKRAPFAWKKWPAIFVRSTCHRNGRSGFFCPLDRAFEHRAVYCCRGSTDWRLEPVFWSNVARLGKKWMGFIYRWIIVDRLFVLFLIKKIRCW